jgi:NADH dehydrogenase [ubiquinone] 1 alpha subcomplex assembly factor 5
MPAELFDMQLRAMRRDRAARLGPELFLYERVFADCLERVAMMQRRFRHALLIGCPDPAFVERMKTIAADVAVIDPGSLLAAAAGGDCVVEDSWAPEPGCYDLVLAIGTLDTVNDLPRALLAIRLALEPDGLLVGAMAGGETLPQLRSTMRVADQVAGAAAPHVHPRVEPAALVGLLSAAGFERPVVDVDRVPVSYRSLDRLIDDLRRMGGTNVLSARPRRSISGRAHDAAMAAFAAAGEDGRTVETFEILHIAGWTPRRKEQG